MSKGLLRGPTLDHYQNIANRFPVSNEFYLVEYFVKRTMITVLLRVDSEEPQKILGVQVSEMTYGTTHAGSPLANR